MRNSGWEKWNGGKYAAAADCGGIEPGGCGNIPACGGAVIVGWVGPAVCIGLHSGIVPANVGETVFVSKNKEK